MFFSIITISTDIMGIVLFGENKRIGVENYENGKENLCRCYGGIPTGGIYRVLRMWLRRDQGR
jgi:hypothetical protein